MKISVMKNVRVLAVLVLLFISCFALLSCQSAEDAVRERADADFAEVKNHNDESLAQTVGDTGADASLEMFGIDTKELLQSWLTGFDYTIDEVTVDGDEAVVTVTLTHKSLEEAVANWETEFTALISDESSTGKTQSELFATAGELLLANINKAPLSTSTVDIPYVKTDGRWMAASGADSILSEAFAGTLL